MNWFDFTSAGDAWAFVAAVGALISATGATALAVIAYKGLGSLRLAQQDMVNRATRDARQCAIARCKEVAEVIIPKHSKMMRGLREGGKAVPIFVEHPSRAEFEDRLEYEQRSAAADWVGKLLQTTSRTL